MIFGKAGGIGDIDLANLSSSQGFAIVGPAFHDGSNLIAASAGDVNGDGYDDLVLGSQRHADDFSGIAFIVYGTGTVTGTLDLGTMAAAQGSTITIPASGNTLNSALGASVAGVGDVNGDGFADVIVGAPDVHAGGVYMAGSAYLLFGSSQGIASLDLTTMTPSQGHALNWTQQTGFAGSEVAGLGDVNGDGIDDFAVGVPGADSYNGSVVVRFGIPDGTFAGGLAPTEAQGFVIQGRHMYWTVRTIAGAGDVNGDGYADILVGEHSGLAYLLWGKAGGFGTINLATLSAAQGIEIDRSAIEGTIFHLAGAGDVNGDGFDDFFVGINDYDSYSGAISTESLIFGSASLSSVTLGTTDGWTLRSNETNDYLGLSGAFADVNDDGFSDLIAGARDSRVAGYASGAVYVVYGDVPTTVVLRTGTVASQTLAGGDFDDTLSGLGGDDELYGNGGEDMLNGGAGNDTLIGGAGSDSLNGEDGDDTISVDYGDSADGGAGHDTLELSLVGAADVVSLWTDDLVGSVPYDLAGGTIVNFETVARVDGSEQTEVIYATALAPLIVEGAGGDDVVFGYASTVDFRGGDGWDAFYSGSAADTFNGGEGHDTVLYELATAGVTVFLAPFQGQSATSPGGDVLSNVESLVGSTYNDTLHGSEDYDQLDGGSGDDTLYGHGGNDNLSGNWGSDSMFGGAGDDLYQVHDAGDQVFEAAGEGDVDSVFSSVNWTLGAGQQVERIALVEVEDARNLTGNDLGNWIKGNAWANVLTGGDGEDSIDGFGGDDRLDPGIGHDIVDGGAGTDVLVLHWSDLTEAILMDLDEAFGSNGTAGTITGGSGRSVSFSNVEAVDIAAGSGNDQLYVPGGIVTGNEGNDYVVALGGPVRFYGGEGGDQFQGSDAADYFDGGSGGDSIEYTGADAGVTVSLGLAAGQIGTASDGDELRNVESVIGSAFGDVLNGSNGANFIAGYDGNDLIDGKGGNDELEGGSGDDSLWGGAGDDVFHVRDAGDLVFESADQGYDQIFAYTSYTLAAGQSVELLTAVEYVPSIPASFNLAGNELMNRLEGNSRNNILNGGAGSDTLVGGAGNDTLIGGTGNDTMTGGLGDDLFYVDSASDVVSEAAGEGNDRVLTGVSYELGAGAHVENLATTDVAATTAINLGGNALANAITGNAGSNWLAGLAGDDVLDGGLGADHLQGGTGNDAYHVDSGDWVDEQAGQGTDIVLAAMSHELAAEVENLALTGGGNTSGAGNALANVIIGNAGNNWLAGLAGDDVLDGGLGADHLQGGTGNDWYYVDDAGDWVHEEAGEGTDLVIASISHELAANAENLVLGGAGNLNGAGNALANRLTGNAGNNWLAGAQGDDVLEGGLGADHLQGGAGNDWYYVDDAGEWLDELAGEGTDWVLAAISYELAAEVENLTLTGAGNLNGAGNALTNVLTGNAGDNWLAGAQGDDVLDGGLGGDHLQGGTGNDWYYVDNAGEWVDELAGEGTDHVIAAISYQLAANVENLTLDGVGNLNGAGNALANVIAGNAGNNWLAGAQGDDVLHGGLGADKMEGGTDNDTYHVDNAGDWVIENAGEGTDQVLASISYELAANVENLMLDGVGNLNGAGNALANVLTGNAGNNWLAGVLGNDVLDGGLGADQLQGGADQDVFAFTTALGGGNIDWISDFAAADDTIQLDDAVFAGLATGALAAGAFATGAAATEADDRVIYDSNTGALLFDADGLGGVAAVQFATLSAGLTLTSADFLVI